MSSIQWHKVYDFSRDGAEPQQLNSVRSVTIKNMAICLVRSEAGYHAVDDRCPHASGRLSLGWCNEAGYVVCPIHRYSYDPTTGRGLPPQGDYVEPYPVEEREDGIYVGTKKRGWWPF